MQIPQQYPKGCDHSDTNLLYLLAYNNVPLKLLWPFSRENRCTLNSQGRILEITKDMKTSREQIALASEFVDLCAIQTSWLGILFAHTDPFVWIIEVV